jgi:hypothetical protein
MGCERGAAKIYQKKKKAEAEAVIDPPLVTAPAPPTGEDVDTFHIVLLDQSGENRENEAAESRSEFATGLASYGGARVKAAMRLRKGTQGQSTLWGDIIRMQERLRAYTNRERGQLPPDPPDEGSGHENRQIAEAAYRNPRRPRGFCVRRLALALVVAFLSGN